MKSATTDNFEASAREGDKEDSFEFRDASLRTREEDGEADPR